MTSFVYDKSLEGLLTAVFDAYARRTFPDHLIGTADIQPMFTTDTHTVIADPDKAARVWNALEQKIGKGGCDMLMHVWLSELEGSDLLIMRYMRKAFDSQRSIATDFADPDVLEMSRIARKVGSERLHIVQFARFRKAADGIFVAPVSPLYNVLPLTLTYFKDRFSFQPWLVYDLKRSYGYYYNLKETAEVSLDNHAAIADGMLSDKLLAEGEKDFQELWGDYLQALTIKERINPKLQRQHMPRRFWKYMPDKNRKDEQ
jgi:probable DNA metabolism protein